MKLKSPYHFRLHGACVYTNIEEEIFIVLQKLQIDYHQFYHHNNHINKTKTLKLVESFQAKASEKKRSHYSQSKIHYFMNKVFSHL